MTDKHVMLATSVCLTTRMKNPKKVANVVNSVQADCVYLEQLLPIISSV